MDEHVDLVELLACTPAPVEPGGFNPNVVLPYRCTVEHIQQAMGEFIGFLGFINQQLHTKGIQRFESMLMPANFSSMVGEFMNANIPKYCSTLAKNQYHNGHPDLVPRDLFPNDSVQHTLKRALKSRDLVTQRDGKAIILKMRGLWCLCLIAIVLLMCLKALNPNRSGFLKLLEPDSLKMTGNFLGEDWEAAAQLPLQFCHRDTIK